MWLWTNVNVAILLLLFQFINDGEMLVSNEWFFFSGAIWIKENKWRRSFDFFFLLLPSGKAFFSLIDENVTSNERLIRSTVRMVLVFVVADYDKWMYNRCRRMRMWSCFVNVVVLWTILFTNTNVNETLQQYQFMIFEPTPWNECGKMKKFSPGLLSHHSLVTRLTRLVSTTKFENKKKTYLCSYSLLLRLFFDTIDGKRKATKIGRRRRRKHIVLAIVAIIRIKSRDED